MKTLISILLVLLWMGASAQVYNPPLKKGNERYEEGKYDEAEILYRNATEEDDEDVRLRGQFNLGDALYKQERYEEAAEEFSVAAARSENEEIKAKAYHNLGNSYLQQQKFKEAVDAYKNSLKLNPKDDETRHNLARTMKMLQQQQQQQNQDSQEDKEQQDQGEQDQPQDQGQEQDEQDREQQGDGQQEMDEPDDRKNQQPQPREGEISREDAERLLEMLSREEEKVQKKVNEEKVKTKPKKTEKDW